MNRYKTMFKILHDNQEGCFSPFIVIGDPSLEASVKIIETLIAYGANAIEIGIPFSDPLADGPTIQKANIRALKNNNTIINYFKELKKIRKKYINIPIGILIYANLIYNVGINNFYKICYDSGIDSVLIADVPIEESNIFYNIANQYNIDSIFICPPDAQDSVLFKIINYAKGYIYLLSRPGVTGIENKNILINLNLIKKIKNKSNIPILQGFGISNTSQIKKIIKSGVSGVICGSVIIDIIEKNLHSEKNMLEKIKNISILLKMSTKLVY